MKKLSTAAGALLFLVSCFFSVKLLNQFGVSGVDRMIWSICGILFMVAEFIFAVLAIRFIGEGRNVEALVFSGLYAALFCVSVSGSIGFQYSTSFESDRNAAENDSKYQLMKSSLSAIDLEIEKLQIQADEYAKKKYFTKGVEPTMRRIEAAQARRTKIYDEIMVYRPVASGQSAFWEKIAGFVGSDNTDGVKFFAFVIIACLVDLIGAALIAIGIIGEKKKPETPISDRRAAGFELINQEKFKTINKKDPDFSKEDIKRYVETAFDYNFPGRRKISEKAGIGQAKGDLIHKYLREHGYISVDGVKTTPAFGKDEILMRL